MVDYNESSSYGRDIQALCDEIDKLKESGRAKRDINIILNNIKTKVCDIQIKVAKRDEHGYFEGGDQRCSSRS